MKIWFLKWLIHWVGIVESIIGVVTFTLWSPPLSLEVAGVLARVRYRQRIARELGKKT